MKTNKLLVSILVLVSVLFTACAPIPTPTAPTQSLPTPAPATVASPAATPTTVATSTTVPTQDKATFSPKTFDLPIRFSYGTEWKIDSEDSNQVSLTMPGSDEYFSFIDIKTARIAGPVAPYAAMPFPDDFVTWFQTHGLFHILKTQPVLVGGLPGTQIDIETTSACAANPSWLFAGSGGWRCGQGGHYRLIYMDNANGERLLVMIEGYSAEDIALKVDAAQKVLDTVVFEKSAAVDQPLTTFLPKSFNLPISLHYGHQWSIGEEYSDEVLLNYAGHDAGIAIINVKNAKFGADTAFPDDFVTWIQSPGSLFRVDDSKPVLIDGFQGIQINATATCGDEAKWIILSGTSWKCPKGEHIGFIYLGDVHGERILIQIQGSPDGKDFKFILEEAQKMLDTIVF